MLANTMRGFGGWNLTGRLPNAMLASRGDNGIYVIFQTRFASFSISARNGSRSGSSSAIAMIALRWPADIACLSQAIVSVASRCIWQV